MRDRSSIEEFPFGNPNEENGYMVFPDSLINEKLVVFHGTAEADLDSIIKNNFRVSGELESISFSTSSNLALGYGCGKRSKESPKGAVLAVRLKSLEKPHVVNEGGIVHLYKPEEVPPTVIGYCIIPSNYVYS